MTIPNLITIARLIIVPLVIVMIVERDWFWAFALFVIAGVSDAIDGAIARRFDMHSNLGRYLDPIADKALLVSIYVTLALVGVLPAWLAILVVSRDMMIVAAVILSWLVNHPVTIKPLLVSKLNTAAQITLAATFLFMKAFGLDLMGLERALIILVAVLTLGSMGAYLAVWLKHMAQPVG